jgi:hypothetical protein
MAPLNARSSMTAVSPTLSSHHFLPVLTSANPCPTSSRRPPRYVKPRVLTMSENSAPTANILNPVDKEHVLSAFQPVAIKPSLGAQGAGIAIFPLSPAVDAFCDGFEPQRLPLGAPIYLLPHSLLTPGLSMSGETTSFVPDMVPPEPMEREKHTLGRRSFSKTALPFVAQPFCCPHFSPHYGLLPAPPCAKLTFSGRSFRSASQPRKMTTLDPWKPRLEQHGAVADALMLLHTPCERVAAQELMPSPSFEYCCTLPPSLMPCPEQPSTCIPETAELESAPQVQPASKIGRKRKAHPMAEEQPTHKSFQVQAYPWEFGLICR